MDILKPTAEHIALYVRFWIEFFFPSAGSLEPFEGSGTIQPQLIIFLGIGVLVAWMVGQAAGMLGLPDDPSTVFQMAKGMGYDDIPRVGLAAILATLALSAVFHGLARVWLELMRLPERLSGGVPERPALGAHLGGNIYDTLNGAVGFVAFFMPLGVLIMALALWGAQHLDPALVLVPAALLSVAAIFVYLPAALAATHTQTKYLQVLISLCGVSTTIMLMFDWLG
jgi:hypothetical protein